MAPCSWSKPSNAITNPKTSSAQTQNVEKVWHHNSTNYPSPGKINRTTFPREAVNQAISEATQALTKNALEPTSPPGLVSPPIRVPKEPSPPVPPTASKPKTGPPFAAKPTPS
ncbi:hypothetical protein HII31_02295 [Pseudocercospora fuligena]|uniref:Uncharacterized protein n=1 Tax=Pseudocercospora fuligena TaxID=685502 RepID=A0A8H6VKX5_9PEZI|nr:hypothetical protein HII31_02295 [Pseudocercospora fuligena]